ncbi:MAG: cell wall metabolism sensor histidine kinase WalK [Pirellulaceae bacterium]|nr:cell wall metabolism sensor histidine kinase WalK [Pirellulaceae bacterium]
MIWLSRLSVKLFLVYAALNLTLAIGYVTWVGHWQRQIVTQQMEDHLLTTAKALRSHLATVSDDLDRAVLQSWVDDLARQIGMRITLIDPQGIVLADSLEDPLLMENHAARPEVKQALEGDAGKAARHSNTVRMRMLYTALPLRTNGELRIVLRIAMPLHSIDEQVATIHRYLWILATAVGAVSLTLTLLGARQIMLPLSQLTDAAEAIAAGNYKRQIPKSGNDELGTLARAVDHMRRELMIQMNEQRENSQRLETVLSSMTEGILAVNADHRVLFANAASRRLLGIETAEVAGRTLLEVSRHRILRNAASEAMEKRKTVEQEFETLGAARRLLAMRTTCLPGNPCPGVVIVLYDITELRRLENVRRDFAANVSHELKTPLSSIKAYAETLRLGALDDKQHNMHFVQRIEEQAERLHQLIVDLLQLARVESGREAFDIREVALDEVVADCESVYGERASAKGLHLEIQLPDEPVLVRADENGLVTILDNLFANALQYTPSGGRVTIRIHGDASHAVLEVEDTGVGISARDQQRVFERFYRVDKARSRDLGGTGLGLAIVKHLTQSFGGEIRLRSELGQGSTFSIRLPRQSPRPA